jgi:hypothetical protein
VIIAMLGECQNMNYHQDNGRTPPNPSVFITYQSSTSLQDHRGLHKEEKLLKACGVPVLKAGKKNAKDAAK